jgi:hypothetical protein
MADFVKTSDQDFRAQASLVYTVVTGSPTTYGQTAGTMITFSDLLDDFTTSLADHVAAQEEARAKTQVKDAARALLEAAYRDVNRVAQVQSGITDGQLAAAGLPVHDSTRTPGSAPTQRAEVQVVVNGQEHGITVVAPTNRKAARPPEARFTELYRVLVAAGQPLPSGIDQMELVGVYTASRFSLQYDSDDIGKTVVYAARYVGSKNQPGPAGATGATVAASVAA